MILVLLLAIATLAAFFLFGSNDAASLQSEKFTISFAQLQKVMVAWFALGALLVVFFAARALPATSDVTHPESSVLYSAELAAKSGRLYSDLNSPPYTPTPYGPFFYSSLQAVARFTGSAADQIRRGYRWFDFGCFLLLPFVVFSFLRRMKCSLPLALTGALASISAFFFHTWNITARPDIPALLLSILALWFVTRHEEPHTSDIILAAAACTSAILFKQSFLAAPLAIFLVLVVRRRFTDVLVFLGADVLFGSAALGYYIARGEPVIRQILLVGKSPIDLHSSLFLINECLPVGLGIVVLLFGCAGFWLAVSSDNWRLKLLGFYFFFSTLVGMITILQVGGNCNYFFEMWVASALLLPFVFPKLEGPWNLAPAGLKWASMMMLAVLLLQQAYELRQVAKIVKNYDTAPLHDLRVFSTLPYFTLHGKDPQFLDPFLLTIAEQHKVWSPDPLLKKITGQEFDVVILMEAGHQLSKYRGYDLHSPRVVAAFKENYQPTCRTDALVVLHPISHEVGFSAADASRVLGESCFADGDSQY